MKKMMLILAGICLLPGLYAQVYLDPEASIDDRVTDLMQRMSLEEKVGQMIQAERGYIGPQGDSIAKYYLGSVLSGGGSNPGSTVESWIDMYNNFQGQALSTSLAIPMIYGIDAVHGNNNVYGATIFPHNIGLGCTRDPDLVEACARITALEVAATGIDWTFSPCLAVPRNERWGRTYEGFGEVPDLPAELGAAAILGYQTEDLGNEDAIIACAKHFVGDGGTQGGIDQGNTVVDESELRELFLAPYYPAIDAGVATVMASYNSWNGVKCHGSKYLLTDILKTELGFEGFIVSDWKGINQLNGDFKAAIGTAINAGIDMAMQPDDYVTFYNYLLELVNEGTVPVSRIDDAVERILKVKFAMGLFENPYADYDLVDSVGCVAHRLVARKAVRESMVLLKNSGALPLSKDASTIVVAGSRANDIGVQCGGWTISWQGSSGSITSGTTIRKAVENVVGSTHLKYVTGTSIPDGDAVIVVVGEDPYAEGAGDLPSGDADFYIKDADQQIIDAAYSKGLPLIVVILSGRPLILEDLLDKADAVVAAWLPGTEGDGIADVLFGDYDFTGRLSHSWPASESKVPVNFGDTNYNPLFEYGFGLDYSSLGVSELTTLSEPEVYPNPVQDELHIRNSGDEDIMVSIFDMSGRLVFAAEEGKATHYVLSLGKLPEGLYLMKITTGDKTYTQKIIRQE